MNQFLPRGASISNNQRIKKMIASEDTWQIYLTQVDAYVLAVKHELYQRWVDRYSLPQGIFLNDEFSSCRVFKSSGNYLVSSLSHGPYPENNGQVEAFSIAFHTACSIWKEAELHDAIYIEEFSLLLPVTPENTSVDIKTAYGKWLTGGVPISIDSVNRVADIMSWLPKKALLNSIKMAGFEIPKDGLYQDDDLTVTAESFQTSKSFSAIKQERFSLVGRPELERFLNENIIDIVLNQEQYKRMGIAFPGATILYGPPGSGKTYAIDRLSEYLGWQRFDIDSNSIASSYIHDTSKKISEVFRCAIKAAPSILVIDEMEAFLMDRGLSGPAGTHHIEEVSEFLRRIPEAITKGVLVFAMTNMMDSIDPAILRRGRFDHIVEVKLANAEEIEALLRVKFAELPTDESVDPAAISTSLALRPLSDVAFILRESGKLAVKYGMEQISMKCFSEAISSLPKQKESRRIGF